MDRENLIDALALIAWNSEPKNAQTITEAISMLKEQEADKNKYEYKYDHTDCLWYGSGNCPSTCSQYRDGWNDAMDYIFKDGKGYQPYRRSVK